MHQTFARLDGQSQGNGVAAAGTNESHSTMKIRVTLKDPDTMHDAVDEAAKKLPKPDGISAKEWKQICEERADEAKAIISRHWMEYGEYLAVDFDTDALTATVIPIK